MATPPLTVPDEIDVPTCVAPSKAPNVTVPSLTDPAVLVTVAFNASVCELVLNCEAAGTVTTVVVVAVFTVNVRVLSLLVEKFVPALYVAWTEYTFAGVPAGTLNDAEAALFVTVPDVAAVPICVAPSNTPNVTVPEFTASVVLVIVALRLISCELVLYVTAAFVATVVVDAGLTGTVTAIVNDSCVGVPSVTERLKLSAPGPVGVPVNRTVPFAATIARF